MIQRNTTQRACVLNAIEKLGHAEIADIVEYMNKTDAKISLATVYRSLGALEENGDIRVITVNGKILYETVKFNHYHFCCRNCGKVFDIKTSDVPGEPFACPEEIKGKHINQYELTFYGTCSKCQKLNNN